MQTATPFRAWRFNPQKAGPLASLVAPPYDVIDASLQADLYERSPYNVVRVDLGITTPNDTGSNNPYTRAAAQLAQWKAEGILVPDRVPTMTFVEEVFTGPDGQRRRRRGFLALMKLYDFGEGVVFPHERTLSGPKEDRLRLLQATYMGLSPVFLLYDLPGDDITRSWENGPGATPPAEVVVAPDRAPVATQTRLWPVSDPDILALVQRRLADSRFVIADGHHRYETALHFWKYERQQQPLPGSAYVLAYFTNMADPALSIYATHRLVRGLDPALLAQLPKLLEPDFAVERLEAGGASAARLLIDRYLAAHPRGAFGMWGPALDAAYGFYLRVPEAVRALEPEASPAYCALDVTILQDLVLQKILGLTPEDITAETHLTFFQDPAEAFGRLAAGEFQVGFFMNPLGLDQIHDIAFANERMPQKATYFYPKLPTGLVFHDLHDEPEVASDLPYPSDQAERQTTATQGGN